MGRPGLRATVLEGNPESLLNELRTRRIEIIVGRLALADADSDLTKDVLYDEELSVAARVTHPLHRRRRIRLSELLMEPWILPPPNTAFSAQVAAMFDGAGLAIPRHQILTLSVPLNLGLVMRTNYLTILPRSLLTLGFVPPSISPLPVALLPTRGPVGFIRLAGASETPALREFMTATRAVVATMAAKKKAT